MESSNDIVSVEVKILVILLFAVFESFLEIQIFLGVLVCVCTKVDQGFALSV